MFVENVSPFEWAFQHLMLLGWPAITYAAWKISKFIEHVAGRAQTVEKNIDVMSTNHFPHMEASLANQDRLLQSIDENIKRIADRG